MGSFTKMGWAKSGSFGQVFCISVLEHIPDKDRRTALREFRRVLRRGGSLVLTVDHPRVPLQQLLQEAKAVGLAAVGSVDTIERPRDVTFPWRPTIELRVWRGRFRAI